MKKPIAFFVHHQGRGHAQRTMALLERFSDDREVIVMTAAPALFDACKRDITLVALPDMIGARVPTAALHEQPTPSVMHCAPLGVSEMRRTMRTILDTLDAHEAGLFVIDVSAEIALLARAASVPAVQVRMHGKRSDVAHIGAYEACVGMLAPFDERLEQDEYPAFLRRKTFYTGGLSTTQSALPTREQARARLALPADGRIVVVLTGGGGAGTPYAPLTVAARACPDTLWLVLGPTHREGHETDFSNLQELGWVTNVADYLAAADVVIASAGDNTVHEIARAAQRYIVMPEWRYFDEQCMKAQALCRIGAAVSASAWPGDYAGWHDVLRRADALDPEVLRSLYAEDAAAQGAAWLERLVDRLWNNAEA